MSYILTVFSVKKYWEKNSVFSFLGNSWRIFAVRTFLSLFLHPIYFFSCWSVTILNNSKNAWNFTETGLEMCSICSSLLHALWCTQDKFLRRTFLAYKFYRMPFLKNPTPCVVYIYYDWMMLQEKWNPFNIKYGFCFHCEHEWVSLAYELDLWFSW